jgi:hypothetical protein
MLVIYYYNELLQRRVPSACITGDKPNARWQFGKR